MTPELLRVAFLYINGTNDTGPHLDKLRQEVGEAFKLFPMIIRVNSGKHNGSHFVMHGPADFPPRELEIKYEIQDYAVTPHAEIKGVWWRNNGGAAWINTAPENWT